MHPHAQLCTHSPGILLDKVQVIPSHDNGPVHLGGLDNACEIERDVSMLPHVSAALSPTRQDAAADADIAGERALLVDVGSCSRDGGTRFLAPHCGSEELLTLDSLLGSLEAQADVFVIAVPALARRLLVFRLEAPVDPQLPLECLLRLRGEDGGSAAEQNSSSGSNPPARPCCKRRRTLLACFCCRSTLHTLANSLSDGL